MTPDHPLRVLFLCTRNSARSQMAEAILNQRRDPRVEAYSAGTFPGERVHPAAMAELRHRGIDSTSLKPKDIESFGAQRWDIVITVCDSARESCPTIPGRPAMVHWGMPDPAEMTGNPAAVEKAFRDCAGVLSRRIDLMLALPLEKLEALALEQSLTEIARSLSRKPA
jgi:protein-tyrosine-phosphatase